MNRFPLLIGSLAGMLGVIAGAFGAHALRQHVSVEMLGVWHTAVEYQMYHAVALLLIAAMPYRKLARAAAWLFTVGIIVFSGSLYVLVLTGEHKLGMFTPIGGGCFIVGWAMLGLSAIRKPQTANC